MFISAPTSQMFFKVYELFGRAGDVRRVIMGLDRFKKTPCGFCFVEFVFWYFTYAPCSGNVLHCVYIIGNLQILYSCGRRSCRKIYQWNSAWWPYHSCRLGCWLCGRPTVRKRQTRWTSETPNFTIVVRLEMCICFQVRDEYRKDFDPGRGGWNKMMNTRCEW